MVIPLGRPLPVGSSDLLGTWVRRGPRRRLPAVPIWSCSGWGLPCPPRHRGGGALLPHRFTLTGVAAGGLFSVALSFESPRLVVDQHLALGARTFLGGRPLRAVRRDHPPVSGGERAEYTPPGAPRCASTSLAVLEDKADLEAAHADGNGRAVLLAGVEAAGPGCGDRRGGQAVADAGQDGPGQRAESGCFSAAPSAFGSFISSSQ
jgi:hypothetical protein